MTTTSDSGRRIPVVLHDDTSYDIVVDAIARLPNEMKRVSRASSKCLVVTDDNVGPLYGEEIADIIRSTTIDVRTATVPAGEESKSMDMFKRLVDEALDFNIKRGDLLVALGGGVVGDLGGFVAATTLRGVTLIHIPTTLIAQVDSSIGGKTGINHARGKNLVGSFYQPALVMTDAAFLSTLNDRNFAAGLAELIKHGLIDTGPLHDSINRRWQGIVERDVDVLRDILPTGIRVKTDIVQRDPREQNVRQYLNFGHTFAHAIELATGYGRLLHGEAVSIGMKAALHLSKLVDGSFDPEPGLVAVGRIPVTYDMPSIPVDEIIACMSHDKKRTGEGIRFVLLRALGEPYVTDVGIPDIRRALQMID